MDFYRIVYGVDRKGNPYVEPDFNMQHSSDFMVRSGDFYAIWNEEKGLWSTNEFDVFTLMDRDLREYAKTLPTSSPVLVRSLSVSSSPVWPNYNNFLKNMPDTNVTLDNSVTFLNTEVHRDDYASKRLPYPLEEGPIDAYEEIISTLYEPSERAKIEWAIGSIIKGDSKRIQKFLVLYGEAGSGKSTILNIIQWLFDGYYTMFEAKALVGHNNAFSTDAFRTNPLVAIQHDGDLSRIDDNSKLNSIVSHEEMQINEKYKPSYTARMNCFLFMATNRPVKITDAKSGIIRRLIDVRPSGEKVPPNRYYKLLEQIKFELGHIAAHCLKVYESMGMNYYDRYIPEGMMLETDPFFNFVEENYLEFKRGDGTTLKHAWDMYKEYFNQSGLKYDMPKHRFREELKNYFEEFYPITRVEGSQTKNYYKGFKWQKFEGLEEETPMESDDKKWLNMDSTESIFDKEYSNCPAQYATGNETPMQKWGSVTTTLDDLDTSRLHYVRVPENHIVIDFDLKDSDGNKSKELNLEAAEGWPKTYAEFSKGGSGVHLHYIYDGDVNKLSRLYGEHIEVKVFTGKSSLRRKLTFCNDLPISHISSGLPFKESETVIDFDAVLNEKAIRTMIEKNLRKEYHSSTVQSVDFIHHILEEQYAKGAKYDVTDLRPRVMAFANNSSNQAVKCLKLVNSMKWQSADIPENANVVEDFDDDELIFYDVEVFPNLFLVNYKVAGEGRQVVRMINPTAEDLEPLFSKKLVGFNCRRYDNHIIYARYLGYSNEELFQLSKRIINADKRDDSLRNCFFREAYNLSYTDVYDFASAGNKKSLKKFEIELGIHHQELGLPWDQPVPEDLWVKVAEYCDNDVLATEAVFNHLKGDWTARQMLAKLSGLSVNDTTNNHTTRIIFGSNRNPQLVYTDLSTIFPGYEYVNGKNMYRGEDVGRGGYVWAVPGIYHKAKTFDVAGMHPASIIALNYFGEYTPRFKDMVDARTAIKHKDYEKASKMMNGALAPYLKDEKDAKGISSALKTANNSCYGLTSASFPNAMKHPDNVNNIVALRGALFMVTLRDEIVKRGGKPFHIKTDSVKVEDPSPELENFIIDFGKQYGYQFEVEHSFEKICLVNQSVYIAKLASDDPDSPGKWTATGAQFQHPYIFKTLFSHEALVFDDYRETKEVKGDWSIYLDRNEDLEDPTALEVEYEKQSKKLPFDHPALIELRSRISECHNYQFVGRIGSFIPVVDGCGGGRLVKTKDGIKYDYVNGASGFRWLEAETVKDLDMRFTIAIAYYRGLVDDAIASISEFGDAEAFIADDIIDHPFDVLPWCDKDDCNSCADRQDCHDMAASFVTDI